MPSEHRKQELLALLGNCIIVLILTKSEDLVQQAKEASEIHISELNQDYPGWQEEL